MIMSVCLVAWTAAATWTKPICKESVSSWPVLKTYEGEALRCVKLPLGGIGTGTVSLRGRGSLVDWELKGRPAKGHVPYGLKGPHFAIRYETPDGVRKARILEGPLLPEEYEGASGCRTVNHGFPRFEKAVFKTAYPLGQIQLSDATFLLQPQLEAFNPLVPGDAEASGIPAALFRWSVTNPTAKPLSVTLVASMPKSPHLVVKVPDGMGEISRATDVREPGWNVATDRYWRRLLEKGDVADTPKDDSTARKAVNANQLAVKFTLAAGETRKVPFVLAWRYPDRKRWARYTSTNACDQAGNWYATKYPTAEAAADDLLTRLPELEARTIAFVRSILDKKVPDVIKEAALFNLSTLRSETCWRDRNGHFYGWEGCYDTAGSCEGNCSHVWGYEHALIDVWPDLGRDLVETYFTGGMDGRGHIRVRTRAAEDKLPEVDAAIGAADGQMQCLVKAYECWRKVGGDAWLAKMWPRIRKALAFCWVKGGWDADCDGVMEGCQHNTMDVEYYGPNPQMEFLYLAALQATEAMARARGDIAFADKCRDLRTRGSAWTEKNLFNGSYYEHKIVPPTSADAIAPGLRHCNMGAQDLSNPDYQLGAGCLVDQLLGDYAARAVGLEPVVDAAHERTTLETILDKCRHAPDSDACNCMRSFVLRGESSLLMAWYPSDRMPRSPFPYFTETMTGFEYVVAGLLAMNGDWDKAERVVRDIRDRYDGVKRNPFDEAECGHHYARALAAWTVMKAFESKTKCTIFVPAQSTDRGATWQECPVKK